MRDMAEKSTLSDVGEQRADASMHLLQVLREHTRAIGEPVLIEPIRAYRD